MTHHHDPRHRVSVGAPLAHEWHEDARRLVLRSEPVGVRVHQVLVQPRQLVGIEVVEVQSHEVDETHVCAHVAAGVARLRRACRHQHDGERPQFGACSERSWVNATVQSHGVEGAGGEVVPKRARSRAFQLRRRETGLGALVKVKSIETSATQDQDAPVRRFRRTRWPRSAECAGMQVIDRVGWSGE